jgi:trehalose/maltose transport system substrate-binding protein
MFLEIPKSTVCEHLRTWAASAWLQPKADWGIPLVVLPTELFHLMLAQVMEIRWTPMADIFISYATVDRPFAHRLADALKACGWSVWWDESDLRSGEHFDHVIEKQIRTAGVVVVVWSKASVESGWVRDEAALALEKKKLLPLRIDMADLPMRFRNIHTVDLSSWTGETEAEPFRKLVKDLSQQLALPIAAPRNEAEATKVRIVTDAVGEIDDRDQGTRNLTENAARNGLFHPPRPPGASFQNSPTASVTVVTIVVLSLVWVGWTGWNRPLRNVLSSAAIWMLNPFYNHPPAVPLPINQSLTYYGDRSNNLTGKRFDEELSERFEIDTGIKVTVINPVQEDPLIPIVQPAEEKRLSALKQEFEHQKDTYDIVMIDIVWASELAEHFIDLEPYFKDQNGRHMKGIIKNNTINGKFVAMPMFLDLGLLYYRDDLLSYYQQDLPKTWEDLKNVAAVIQKGERKGRPDRSPNSKFIGFAWQGAAYEGLSVNALEWIGSQGGLDQNTGQIVDKQVVVESLDRARAWIQEGPDQISENVDKDNEDKSLKRFIDGNAAFLRMWPNAYTMIKQAGEISFKVAPLPSAKGQKSVGIVGGWQLAVPKYSRNQKAAVEFIRYLVSPEVQTWRALEGTYIPTIHTVADSLQVKQTIPFLDDVYKNIKSVMRPSSPSGQIYSNASECFYKAVHKAILSVDPKKIDSTVSDMQQDPACKTFFK